MEPTRVDVRKPLLQSVSSTQVKVMKHAQEIFARADGEVEHASAGAPFVVEEGERIVQVGATEQYEIKFTESDGPSLPVVFKRHSCSELTYVHSVGKDMAVKKGRDQLVRTPASYLAVEARRLRE